MKIPYLLPILAVMLMLASATASAQTDRTYDTGILQARIDSLTQRLDKIEKKTSGWDKVLANLPRITGYGILGYEWNDTGETPVSSFHIKSVRLILVGDIGRKFDYKFQFEFVSPKLMDAYLRYKIHPAFSLQAGQFRTFFSLEGPMIPAEMEATDYAPVVKAICVETHDTRDIGLAAYGSLIPRDGYSIIEYFAGVYNGEGKNSTDRNSSKDFIARVKLNPSERFTISASFGYGERGETYVHNTRYAAGLWWHGERFFLRSEYMALRQNDWAAGMKRNIEGCYATAGYNIKKFCPIVRYNWMESDLSGTSVRQSDYLVGIDYHPLKYLRLQANYTRTQYAGNGGANIFGLLVTGTF